jgi:uncharacterized protein YqgV (UPF0045/DUF77 family)
MALASPDIDPSPTTTMAYSHQLLVDVVVLWLLVLLLCPLAPSALSVVVPQSQGSQDMISVRFSLYPNVAKDDPANASMKQAVKVAVGRLGELGVSISPDDVSTCLVGSESALFEALRSCFARASVTASGTPRGISMQATVTMVPSSSPSPLSSSDDGSYNNDALDLPLRTATDVDDGMEFVRDAYLQPPRIAAQFALYPIGTTSFTITINHVFTNAKRSSCWKAEIGQFSAMLDGNGNEVFDVLRESFALLVQQADVDNVAMTLTLTANKNAWPEEDRSRPFGV